MNELDYNEIRRHFLEEVTLYQPLPPKADCLSDTVDLAYYLSIINYLKHTVDTHCLACGEISTFRLENPIGEFKTGTMPLTRTMNHIEAAGSIKNTINNVIQEVGAFTLNYTCQRFDCPQKIIVILGHILNGENKTFAKIGQYPSLADIQLGHLSRYKKALSKPYDIYFSKAIGLNAHGVGIGSVIYLRRIFEELIRETLVNNRSTDPELPDEETFRKNRMEDRVNILKNHLPDFLIECKDLYGVLSDGVHNLSEEQCLSIFPILKACIIEILEERRERQEKDERRRASRKALTALGEKKSEPRGE